MIKHVDTTRLDCHFSKPAKTTAYYIRKNRRSQLPTRLLILDTETKGADLKAYHLHKMYMGYTWFMRLNKDGSTRNQAWKYWANSESLCRYIIKKITDKVTLHVLGSNVLFDLFASGLVEHFISQGWYRAFIYDKGLKTIITLTKGSRRVKFLAVQNFVPGGVASWGKLLNLPKLDIDFDESSTDSIKEYCKRDCEITGKMFLSYLDFLRGNDLGGFSPTISGQSLRAYRHKFMHHKILHYDRPDVNEFVRAAYFGGRVECFRLGQQPIDKYLKLDINSMYPFVMQQNEYPTKLVQWVRHPSIEYADKILANGCVIAHCKIQTDSPVYGKKLNSKLCFPTGCFDAYLCSGSLRHAIDKGDVVSITDLLVYESAEIFKDYVDYFYPLKAQYAKAGSLTWTLIVKLFLNSLYGKFGEKRDTTIVDCEDLSNDFRREDVIFKDQGLKGIETVCFGRHTITAGDKEGPQSAPGVAAHVTDYARVYLYSLLSSVGLSNVLYCDTDSIFIRESDFNSIRHLVNPTEIGKLKVEATTTNLAIHGLKDYTFGKERKTKGISSKATKIGRNKFRQSSFPNLSTLLREKITSGFPVLTVERELKGVYSKGQVSGSGVVSPFHLTSID